jgi:hypothetical protein
MSTNAMQPGSRELKRLILFPHEPTGAGAMNRHLRTFMLAHSGADLHPWSI